MTTNSNDVLELSPESNKSTDKRITKKDLKALFWRSFPLNIMWSFDRQMNVGFCYDMIPVIKRLYEVDFQSQRNSLNGPRVSAASATRK